MGRPRIIKKCAQCESPSKSNRKFCGECALTTKCQRCSIHIARSGFGIKFCQACRLAVKAEAARMRRSANREAINARRRATYDPVKAKEAWSNWAKDHAEYLDKKNKSRPVEMIREASRKWAARPENRFRIRIGQRKAREKRRGAKGGHTFKEFLDLCIRSGWKCAYCSCDLNEKTVTKDHVIPICKGGTDFIENIALACMPCNCQKQSRSAEVFLEIKRKEWSKQVS